MSSKPLVALMQPSRGLAVPHRGAVEAFLRPTLKGVDRLELKQGTSMLTRCFCMLWCDALNARSQHPITHAALIHDDIAPDPGWLDTLLEEMERTGCDVIHAVSPIKNGRGLTSTAVDNPANPWVVRRLTLHEVFALPETFGAEDIPWREDNACLLPNTGLMLCRFDKPWVEKIVWRFQNRIIKAPDGQFLSQDIPEDWDSGRQFRDLGLKVLGTRKVGLEHEFQQYHTRSAWGDWPTDLAYLEYTRRWSDAASGASSTGWRFPADVDGWLTPAEGKALAELVTGKRVLEVGSYAGRSTICMAQTAASVTAVDTFDGRATTSPRDTLPELMANLSRYGVLDKVTVAQGTSADVLPRVHGPYDVAFIDGAHDTPSVFKDARLATSLLAPDGILAFHDYQTSDPGVMTAVDEMVRQGAVMLPLVESVVVVSPWGKPTAQSNGDGDFVVTSPPRRRRLASNKDRR